MVGLDRNTILRYIQVARQCGQCVGATVDALTDENLSDVPAALGTYQIRLTYSGGTD